MKVIVVGGGKIGFYLTRTLLEHGHEPVLIEKDPDVCLRVANSLDLPVIQGDGTVLDTLENAGIRGCDALIGVSGQDENNLVACQLAKRYFGVKRTVARVNNPKNLPVMKQLGVDIPISSTDNIARLLEHEVDTAVIKVLMSLNRGEASLSELELPSHYKFQETGRTSGTRGRRAPEVLPARMEMSHFVGLTKRRQTRRVSAIRHPPSGGGIGRTADSPYPGSLRTEDGC